jgi:hypothetical protein
VEAPVTADDAVDVDPELRERRNSGGPPPPSASGGTRPPPSFAGLFGETPKKNRPIASVASSGKNLAALA